LGLQGLHTTAPAQLNHHGSAETGDGKVQTVANTKSCLVKITVERKLIANNTLSATKVRILAYTIAKTDFQYN